MRSCNVDSTVNGATRSDKGAPNAAVVWPGADGNDQVAVVELTSASYDAGAATAAYGSEALGGDHDRLSGFGYAATLPTGEELAPVSLFIDSLTEIEKCYLTVHNNTRDDFKVVSSVDTGVFPHWPDTIAAGTTANMYSRALLIIHPCNGEALYQADGGGEFGYTWNNPVTGSNEWSYY